jgi:hypothetical protein
MLLMIGQDDPLELDTILVTAISAAQKLGLHRLGGAKLETAPLSAYANKDLRETSMESPQIRTEVGIRIWCVPHNSSLCLTSISDHLAL